MRFRATILGLLLFGCAALGQDPVPAPRPLPAVGTPFLPPVVEFQDVVRLPINLPTALQLAEARPLDVAVASVRLSAALAQYDRASKLWLPTIDFGLDYARHDGYLQDVVGNVVSTNKQSFMVGAGPNAIVSVSDALYAPLAARQVVRSKRADVQTAVNDSFLAVADAYFLVQQARGEVFGAAEVVLQGDELVRRTDELAKGLVPPLEASRARTELSRRRQSLLAARERWTTAGADLTRLLRLSDFPRARWSIRSNRRNCRFICSIRTSRWTN
jgi:outer membrane protein TolC